ncbi:MAG: hypothetical protein ACOYMA_15480, partial [Bacteroidia bacterium]
MEDININFYVFFTTQSSPPFFKEGLGVVLFFIPFFKEGLGVVLFFIPFFKEGLGVVLFLKTFFYFFQNPIGMFKHKFVFKPNY